MQHRQQQQQQQQQANNFGHDFVLGFQSQSAARRAEREAQLVAEALGGLCKPIS